MAIHRDKIKEYEGLVLTVHERYWLDGMLEEWAEVWDLEKHTTKQVPVGYYGSDGRNLYGACWVHVDLCEEAKRDILRTIKHRDAPRAFEQSVIRTKTAITKGTHAEVIKGRKVPKGTKLEVFWVGERPTYRAMQYSWMNETETIAGCWDADGNKVWIRADYLKNIDPIKSPCAAERKKFIKSYVLSSARAMGVRV